MVSGVVKIWFSQVLCLCKSVCASLYGLDFSWKYGFHIWIRASIMISLGLLSLLLRRVSHLSHMFYCLLTKMYSDVLG